MCGVARGAWGCEVTAVRRLPIVSDDRPGVVRAEPRVRARTVSITRLSQRALRAGAEAYPEQPGRDYLRPRTLEECDSVGLGDLFPCPFVSCKHNLYLDVNERTGSIKLNFPDRDVDEIPATCELHVARDGGITLDGVAQTLNLTRERIRQLESRALAKIKATRALPSDLLDDLNELIALRDARGDL